MDTREIQKLIDFISKSDLSEVNIETAELKLQIKRSGGGTGQHVATNYIDQPPVQITREYAPAASTQPSPVIHETPTVSNTSHLIEVRAPMIGTFYRSAGPDKPNFIEVGDELAEGQTICILEAMKLFNEIESEVSGKIVKILVENATPVEYDQPLFLVDPS
jgi:acetyl-CoA carboxylase biotin carboxyl carrier protein